MPDESGDAMPIRGGAGSALNGSVEPGEQTAHGAGSGEAAEGTETRPAPTGVAGPAAHEHSPWPVLVAVGLLMVGVGVLHSWLVAGIGGAVLLGAVMGWLWQPWDSE